MAMRWRDGWLIRPTAQVRGIPIKGRRWKYPLESMRDDATAWVGPGAPPSPELGRRAPRSWELNHKVCVEGPPKPNAAKGVADWAGDAESRG